MQNVFLSVKKLEARAKKIFSLSESLMIENTASALEAEIKRIISESQTPGNAADRFQKKIAVFILCGSGNNGADGYALARKCARDVNVFVLQTEAPKTAECKMQEKSARNAGAFFVGEKFFFAKLAEYENFSVIVDCIFGTGFHGSLPKNIVRVIEKANTYPCEKIACDVPSGIDMNGNAGTNRKGKACAFFANKTIAAGALKLAYFGDQAKNFCGILQCANIGVSRNNFESAEKKSMVESGNVLPQKKKRCETANESINGKRKKSETQFFLIEKSDVRLPVRKNNASHKGDFGHVAVFAGDKVGAAIIAASAAFSFGAGRVTIVTNKKSVSHFKLPMHLMLSSELPKTANTVSMGSGFGRANENAKKLFSFLLSRQKIACVLDADIFYADELFDFLKAANEKKMRLVLTPHPKELAELFFRCQLANANVDEILQNRISFLKKFIARFPNITLVSKSAVTMIASEKNIYIANEGTSALSKGGTGDVLAGMIASLLAQNYTARDAGITAVFLHALSSKKFGKSFSLTPEKLIGEIEKLQ